MASRRYRYEGSSRGKEGKKSKAKKWRSINRKGETKEGGDMDAFLDKTDASNQDVSISSLSPASNSPVLEVIPPLSSNETENDLLEEKRKVAEKNEENIRVSMEAQNMVEENISIETENSLKEPELKYSYLEDQWSPINPEGKKKYDRAFLLNMQAEPLCLQKPRNLPSVDIIKERAFLQKLPDNNRPSSTPLQTRNYSDPFIPNFATRQSRPPPGGVGRRQSQQGRDKPKKIITISGSFNQDVKLHECGNAWKPDHVKKEPEEDGEKNTQDLEKRVRGILNKLTPQKFQTLVEQVKQLPIDSEEKLKCVINLIFEKAIDEPNFSVPYANMCKHIAMTKFPLNSAAVQGTSFRKALLTKCQTEFEKDNTDEINYKNRLEQIEKAESGEKKKQLKEELEEEDRKSRRRSLGNIKFIGELFKLNMLTAPIMHECLKKLLHRGDEDSLECLCRLLTTIGKELETDKKLPNANRPSSSLVNTYFETMKEIVVRRTTSSRVRFMLQDVIELRENNWVPRRDENNPKTIDQIHLEAHREAQEQQQLLQQTVFQKRNPDDRNMNRKGRGSANYQEDGWNMQPTKTKGAIDPTKIKIPKSVGETDIQLGHGFAKWGQGSSGGNVKNTSQDSENKSTMLKNRFSALATEPNYSNYEPRRGSQRSAASSRESSRSGSNNQPPPLRKSSSQTSTKERKQAIEAVKDFTKSESHKQMSANENLNNETGSTLILKGNNNLSNEEMEKKTKPLIDEFLHNSDFKEAILCVVETVSLSTAPVFVSSAIFQVLERSSISRNLVGQLMHHLVKKKILPLELYFKGLKSVLEVADDCAIDVPKIWQYLAELIEPMTQDNTISLAFLKDAAQPCIANGTAGKLMCELLHIAVKKQESKKKVAQLWKSSGLNWSDFLNESENITDFLKQNKLEWTISNEDDQLVSEKLCYERIKDKLDNLIREDANNETIYDWINANIEEKEKNFEFVRALATSLVESAIDGEGSGSKFNKKKLSPRLPVFQKYLGQNIHLELQLLFALQAIVNRLQHPKGLLLSIFQYLDDEDIISDEAFVQWDQNNDPAEQEGKGVAIKSVSAFIVWIKEQYDDSIEEN